MKILKVAELVNEAKVRYYNRQRPIQFGIAYTSIRESARSFYMLVHHVSGEYLSSLGITKELTLGSGKYARQRVNEEIRGKFEKNLGDHVEGEHEYLEALYIAKFGYYTATRIGAILRFNFEDRNYSLDKGAWMLEVLDKGENGGKLWEKYLVGYALEDFKQYFSKRFDVELEDLENELVNNTKYLFPGFVDDKGRIKYSRIRSIFKSALIDAGIPYKDFKPTHIWRHTFAQDFLRATNWNYELCGSVGGWESTITLKRHYGEMDKTPKINGLMRAMGLPIRDEVIELKF